MLILGLGVIDLFLGGRQIGEKGNVIARLTEVFVFPLPLIAGDEDVELRFVVVINLQQRGGRRNRHGDQNHKRDDCPRHLDLGALMKLGSLMALGFAVRVDGVKHHREHSDANHHADPHNEHV